MTIQIDEQCRGFRAEGVSAQELSLLIYGPIDMGEDGRVDSATVVAQLQQFAGAAIRIYINSPGGVIYGGLAIYNALRRHPARKEVQIDGICASAATIIAMAGDRITASPGTMLMVHAVWNTISGDSTELRREAATLEKLTATLVDLYVKRTGRPRDTVAAWVRDETWFTPAEAKAAGLIDAVGDGQRAVARWDTTAFGIIAPPFTDPSQRDGAAVLSETLRQLRAATGTAAAGTFEPAAITAFARQVALSIPAALEGAMEDHLFKCVMERAGQAAIAAALAATTKLIEGFVSGLESRLVETIEAQLADLAAAYRLDSPGDTDGAGEGETADREPDAPAGPRTTSGSADLEAVRQRLAKI